MQLQHPVIGCGGVEVEQEDFPPFTCAKEKEGEFMRRGFFFAAYIYSRLGLGVCFHRS